MARQFRTRLPAAAAKNAPLFFLRACPRLFCIMHRVVKIACSISDETLDASCAQAAKDAAARGLPFAESCEYNKVCQLFLGCLSSLLPSAHVPIATALRAVLSPNAPPITALEIGSGTAQASHLPRGQSASPSSCHSQHALHLLGEFCDESTLNIIRCHLFPPRWLHFQRGAPHAGATGGSSAKCPARARMLPSARCRPRVLSMQRTRHPTIVSPKGLTRPCSSTYRTCASK